MTYAPPMGSIQGRRTAWTPASLPNVVNLDLFSTHVDAGAGACSQWTDLSANLDHATAAGSARPTISVADANLLTNVLTFDGTDDTMVTSSVTGGQNVLTYVIVCRLTSVTGVKRIIETNTGTAGGHAIFIEGSKLSAYINGAAGQDYVAGNTTIAINTNYEFVVQMNFNALGTTLAIDSWVNRVAQTQTSIVNTGTNTTAVTSTIQIGKWVSAGLQWFPGKMARCSRYEGAFTAPDLASYGSYNQTTHGVP